MTAPLRILCTEILPYQRLKARAEADLGFELDFQVHDFVNAQRIAATAPQSYDVYDQCFHNLDIVWNWRAIQPIQTGRIDTWDEMNDLAKRGGLDGQRIGAGDRPVTRLYVQDDNTLSDAVSDRISMLPTVHNFDSFVQLGAPDLLGHQAPDSWAALVQPQWAGRVALAEEPAIGVCDLVLILRAAGLFSCRDAGNLSLEEIDRLMAAARELLLSDHLGRFWSTAGEAAQRLRSGDLAIAPLWSPAMVHLKVTGVAVRQAVPVEGYRGWHGGMCLAHHLADARLDKAYAWLNWMLSGWPGAVMARQGYYMSVPERVRAVLDPAEWDYWYDGQPAARPLPGPTGDIAVQTGEYRSGGSYRERAAHVAVWNTTMDEHNYLVRRWNELIALAQQRSERPRRAGLAAG